MSPLFMSLLLIATLGYFAWSVRRRWKLLRIGQPEPRFDQLGHRFGLVLRFAFGQARMPRYRWSGIAHILVFSGFLVLLLRSLILWGRGYDADFNFWLFGPDQPLGAVYALLKDTFVLLVLLGVAILLYFRLIKRERRLTLNAEALLILGIIAVMMIADVTYDAARMTRSGEFHRIEFAGYTLSSMMTAWPSSLLAGVEHAGFWTHSALVLIFLNILPYSKHFHIITAMPNVFFADLTPHGRLNPIAEIEDKVEREETLGVAVIDDLSWKSLLDLYTCTECGRCSDVCPATHTGKRLSPKHLTIDLRDHLYTRQQEAMGLTNGQRLEPVPLVSEDLIHPETLWACTSCRACEEECPVLISYVDKIVDLRRHVTMEQSEFPEQLQQAFQGIERTGNPWSYPPEDRLAWAEGLNIPEMSSEPEVEYLFWVGCAPSFDERAKRVTRATAQLLQQAGITFAVLGIEEMCTGDAARRAGNEFLFQMMAQQNIETLSEYNVRKIITTCPHCYNTLKHEYPDFGGNFEVIHHTELLRDLVRQGILKPQHRAEITMTYHDSCYLGRYNDNYDAPREILSAIPGIKLVEPAQTRDRGMCCGAGGAQMFKEDEPGDERVNLSRTDQLLTVLNNQPQTTSTAIASACPFCMRMLTDGLASKEREEVQQLDVAEVLWKAVNGNDKT
jgi:Fe-S oxidoreductase